VQIWRSLDDIPDDLGRTAVVVGNFDGVHLGHQHVIAEARRLADDAGMRVVAVTFDPHPMAVLRPEHAPTALTDLDTRTRLLSAAGVDDERRVERADAGDVPWTCSVTPELASACESWSLLSVCRTKPPVSTGSALQELLVANETAHASPPGTSSARTIARYRPGGPLRFACSGRELCFDVCATPAGSMIVSVIKLPG